MKSKKPIYLKNVAKIIEAERVECQHDLRL